MELESVWRPDASTAAKARHIAAQVLASPATRTNLGRYYAVDSNYAGATFLTLGPTAVDAVTPTDLLAVTTLSVTIHPRAIRNFQQSAELLSEQLRQLDPEMELQDIDAEATAPLMAQFYESVKACLRRSGAMRSNAWVTASKICARKRPQLFPVRDNVVLDLLQLPKTYPVDWPTFHSLMTDKPLIDDLDLTIADVSRTPDTDLGDPADRLRHLDVALWMHAVNPDS